MFTRPSRKLLFLSALTCIYVVSDGHPSHAFTGTVRPLEKKIQVEVRHAFDSLSHQLQNPGPAKKAGGNR